MISIGDAAAAALPIGNKMAAPWQQPKLAIVRGGAGHLEGQATRRRSGRDFHRARRARSDRFPDAGAGGPVCIEARVPTRVYTVSLGGFDTHADEKDTQERQLGEVDAAESGFTQALQADPATDDVVLMGYSEFGRRVRANASAGTDHGTAGPVFVAGASVVPGLHADAPSLTDLDSGDLKATCDFRSIYSELLDKVLGADPAAVLSSAPLGLLA